MKKLSAFARNVRGLRQEFGLSTEKFSEIMEISVSTLGNWERGNAIPHVSHIEDLVNFSFSIWSIRINDDSITICFTILGAKAEKYMGRNTNTFYNRIYWIYINIEWGTMILRKKSI